MRKPFAVAWRPFAVTLRAAFEALGPDVEPSPDVVTILRSFEDAPGPDPATRFRRGRATTRFKIWECPDAELDAAIARLKPVVDLIVREPKSPEP